MISRRQYNDRRKFTASLCNTIRERIADEINSGEGYFCTDSKPIEICRPSRAKRCSIGKKDVKASVHGIHYLKDVKVDYCNCTVIGDRGYISAEV